MTEPNGKPTLHHMNNSQSQRILWLLEELNIEYNLIHYFRTPSARAPAELKKIHPLGKSPLLETKEGVVVSESIAIINYLIGEYGGGRFGGLVGNGQISEETLLKYIKEEELISFASTTLATLTFPELLLEIATKRTPWPLSYLPSLLLSTFRTHLSGPARKAQLAYLQSELGDKEWFSGGAEPGRADFVISFPLDLLAQRGWADFGDYEGLREWRGRVEGRGAWKEALGKGNGYDLTAF